MFENLSNRLSSIFERLKKTGALSETDVKNALREVRVALLEADVALEVVQELIRGIEQKATGQEVTRSISPGQQVIKIVNDELIKVLSGDKSSESNLKIDSPPASILMVGLQGSGKTTSSVKLAKRLADVDKKRVLLASLDTHRPAAMEQLAILANEIGTDVLPIVPNQTAREIASRARQQAMLGGYDVYILDTAGRLHVDSILMEELTQVKTEIKPNEVLLVVDGLTGQDAVNVAKEFDKAFNITGVVITKIDGDSRGGAALSMRYVTQKPIKFVGVGEKTDQLELFYPERIASRILGMGDIVSLVEKAQEQIEKDQADKMMRRFQKGQFNMNDLKLQLEQMIKMGGMKSMLGLIPGMNKMSKKIEAAGFDDLIIRRQIALITSMTKKERVNPKIMQASRKKRTALGAGLDVTELNRLLKMQRQMSDMMKKIGKTGNRSMLNSMMSQLTGKGTAPLQQPADGSFQNKGSGNIFGSLSNFGKKN